MKSDDQRRKEVTDLRVSTRRNLYLSPRDRGLIKIANGQKLTRREEQAVDRLLIEAAIGFKK